MPRTAVATRPKAEVVADTRLEEATLAASLKKLVRAEASRTEVLKGYAEAIVVLRLKLDDLPGRSQAYREAVGRVYSKAGLDEDALPDGTSRAALGASIRYHVAEVLRSSGLAEKAGIALESPSQRLSGARKELAAKRQDPEWLFGNALSFLGTVTSAPDAGLLAMLDQLEAEIARLRGLKPKRGRRRAS